MTLIRPLTAEHIITADILEGISAANTIVNVDTAAPASGEQWMIYGVNAWYDDDTVQRQLTIIIDPGGTPRTIALQSILGTGNRNHWTPVKPILVPVDIIARASLPAGGVTVVGTIQFYVKKVKSS